MSTTRDSIVFHAPTHYGHTLFLRQQDGLWEFPKVGQFEHDAELEPWTDSTFLARVEAPFNPPGVPGTDFQWVCRDYAIDCPPDVYTPPVLPALRRFDGDLLDQIMARVEAFAEDSIQPFKEQTMATRSEFIEAQSRASRALQAFGDDAGAAPSVPGEGFLQYRARLAAQFQKYAPKYKNLDLNRIGDANAFAFIEDAIYADAAQEAARPTSASLRPGELRAIHTPDASGRMLTQYVGSDDGACWDRFNPPIRYVRRFSTPGTAR